MYRINIFFSRLSSFFDHFLLLFQFSVSDFEMLCFVHVMVSLFMGFVLINIHFSSLFYQYFWDHVLFLVIVTIWICFRYFDEMMAAKIHEMPPTHILNMDETFAGFVEQQSKVVCLKEQKFVKVENAEFKSGYTVVMTACAAGYLLPTYVIVQVQQRVFHGSNFVSLWEHWLISLCSWSFQEKSLAGEMDKYDDLENPVYISYRDGSWMTAEEFLKWFDAVSSFPFLCSDMQSIFYFWKVIFSNAQICKSE
jgi:hypothetical protein